MRLTKVIISLLIASIITTACGELAATPINVSTLPTAVSSLNPRVITGGTFRMMLASEPDSIDPALVYGAEGISVANELFEGLTVFDSLNIKPALAESWAFSPDGLNVTFKLRKNMQFSNGDPIKAQDFVYSINRVVQNEASPNGYHLQNIKGVHEVLQLSGEVRKKSTIAGLTAVDDSTLKFELVQPSPDFLAKTTLAAFNVVHRTSIEKFGEKWTEPGNLVGSGPFVLKAWNHSQDLLLDFNPRYREGRAAIDAISFIIVKDLSVAKQKYDANELDTITIGPADLFKVRNDAVQKNELSVTPIARTNFISFNFTKGPFATNKELRKAFYYAIDQSAVTKNVLQGGGQPLTTLLMPGIPGYKFYEAYGFDAKKAKASLAAAGYDTPAKLKELEKELNAAGGFAFTTERVTWQEISTNYVEQFRQNLGIELKLTAVPTVKEYFERRNNKRDFVIFFGSWAADYIDPANFYKPIFGCNVPNAAGGGYCNKDFEEALKKAEAELDQTKRLELYQAVERALQDDAGMIPVFNNVQTSLIKPRVKNWNYDLQNTKPIKDMQLVK